MTAVPFKVIRERRLSTLNPEQRKIWAKLVARRKRLEASQKALEEDEAFFVDGVMFDVVEENHPAVEGMRITDEGLILQVYCECYRCQTKLQQLPPTYVVEQMAKLKLIPDEKLPEARKWAVKFEKENGVPVLN